MPNKPLKCPNCKWSKPKIRCPQCNVYLCMSCYEKHYDAVHYHFGTKADVEADFEPEGGDVQEAEDE